MCGWHLRCFNPSVDDGAGCNYIVGLFPNTEAQSVFAAAHGGGSEARSRESLRFRDKGTNSSCFNEDPTPIQPQPLIGKTSRSTEWACQEFSIVSLSHNGRNLVLSLWGSWSSIAIGSSSCGSKRKSRIQRCGGNWISNIERESVSQTFSPNLSCGNF